MEEINNFQQEPDETFYQACERFKELLMKCPQHYLTEMQELPIQTYPSKRWPNILKNDTMEHLGQEVLKLLTDWQPTKHNSIVLKEKSRRGQYRAAASRFYQRNNTNPLYQERRQMEESLRKFMSESAKRHEENSNLIKEIRASIDVAIRNQRASIKTLEIQIGQMSKKESYGPQFLEAYSYRASHIDNSIPRKEKDPMSFIFHCYINNVCFDNALADLGASVSAMPLSTYLNLGLGELAHTKFIAELTYRTVKHPKGIAENVLVGIGKFVFPVDFIILDMPEDVKVPLILGRPFLSTAHAKIDVFKRKITLRVGEEKIIFKSVKPTSSLIKRVYMLSLRE
ncbi:hypothetical protein Tco_1476505 [Tanacetum coccineum]